MDRCPNCRARLDAGQQCRRCGMELDLLRRVERGFDTRLTLALARLADGDPTIAVEHLDRALSLRRDPLAEWILELLQTQFCPEGR